MLFLSTELNVKTISYFECTAYSSRFVKPRAENKLYKLFDVARTREGPVIKETGDEKHTTDLNH